jgi:hypothetical protein
MFWLAGLLRWWSERDKGKIAAWPSWRANRVDIPCWILQQLDKKGKNIQSKE